MRWNVSLPDAEWYERGSEGLDGLVREVVDQPVVAIDTETTGLVRHKDMPLFWSLGFGGCRRICMPADTLPCFLQAFQDESKTWTFANAKYDLHILSNYGINVRGQIADTAVMHALLYEETSHALKDMSLQINGWKWTDFTDTFKIGKGGKLHEHSSVAEVEAGGRFESVQDAIMWCYYNDRQKLIEYSSNDAYGTDLLYWALMKELQAAQAFGLWNDQFYEKNDVRPDRMHLRINTQWDYFEQIEKPFTRVLFNCERNGILVNTEFLSTLEKEMVAELNQIRRRMNQINGAEFNPNSTQQVREFLIDKEGLKALKQTKGGKTGVKQASVDADFLEAYEGSCEMAKLILRFRKLDKLVGTYVQKMPTFMDNFGRIHTSFNQDVARTGRLSSSEPNMQNIPNAESDVFKIRKAFKAPTGMDIICLDYDQLEMRLLGAASLEQSMIDIFRSGKDIHMGNAELVYQIPYDDLKKAKKTSKEELKALHQTDPQRAAYIEKCLEARRNVKTVGFGLNYGMKEKLLASKLGTTEKVAAQIREQYLNALPAVMGFYEEAINECRMTGYSYTIAGRRRFLPEIMSTGQGDRWKAERQAVNNQIQGSAADAAKLAMINCFNAGLEQAYGCRMLLQIHDELIFECPKETSAAALAEIQDHMTDPFPTPLAVALTASGGIGQNWCEAKG